MVEHLHSVSVALGSIQKAGMYIVVSRGLLAMYCNVREEIRFSVRGTCLCVSVHIPERGFQLSTPVGLLASFQGGIAQPLQSPKELCSVLTGSSAAGGHVTISEWDGEWDSPHDLLLPGYTMEQESARTILPIASTGQSGHF